MRMKSTDLLEVSQRIEGFSGPHLARETTVDEVSRDEAFFPKSEL